VEGKMKAVENISKWRLKDVQRCFNKFRKNWVTRKKSRVLLARFFLKIDNMFLSRSWETWKLFLISLESDRASHSNVSGVGSMMLQRSLLHRTELASASMQALQASLSLFLSLVHSFTLYLSLSFFMCVRVCVCE
jgi:hypothetical protein